MLTSASWLRWVALKVTSPSTPPKTKSGFREFFLLFFQPVLHAKWGGDRSSGISQVVHLLVSLYINWYAGCLKGGQDLLNPPTAISGGLTYFESQFSLLSKEGFESSYLQQPARPPDSPAPCSGGALRGQLTSMVEPTLNDWKEKVTLGVHETLYWVLIYVLSSINVKRGKS